MSDSCIPPQQPTNNLDSSSENGLSSNRRHSTRVLSACKSYNLLPGIIPFDSTHRSLNPGIAQNNNRPPVPPISITISFVTVRRPSATVSCDRVDNYKLKAGAKRIHVPLG
ncbi:hypothetical protein BJ508DRAFT_333467 [Ascobolus immersus RN42]|uniref:Uncharacterized protein n=1 Tax=Ascobolus immersus RN42 TaxID=1160509 RepID=A0A3N4HJG5_ASCIM|nr:hypothetical protein BJ508DRAFT_333467 [Ascobolus immersus RN42]